MRVQRLEIRGTVSSRSDTAGMLRVAGDAVLIERGRPRILVLVCPCGCGEELVINLDEQAGPAWRFYRRGNSLTLFPSVWRDTGCESHFIIWKDRIYLFGFAEDEGRERDELWSDDVTPSHELLLAALSSERFESFGAIAERLDALPWDVLVACRHLVADGLAIEGTGSERGEFRRK